MDYLIQCLIKHGIYMPLSYLFCFKYQIFLCLSQECGAKVSNGCCKDLNQNEITSHKDDKKVRFSGSLSGTSWVRKFGYLCIQEILVLTIIHPYIHSFMFADVKCLRHMLSVFNPLSINSGQKGVSADYCHISVSRPQVYNSLT